MKQYSDTLLLEFLMFSDDINQEIKDFEYSLTSIDPDDIEKIIVLSTQHAVHFIFSTVSGAIKK